MSMDGHVSRGTRNSLRSVQRDWQVLIELVMGCTIITVPSSINIVVMRHADRSPKQKLRLDADMERVREKFGEKQVLREEMEMEHCVNYCHQRRGRNWMT